MGNLLRAYGINIKINKQHINFFHDKNSNNIQT